MIVAQLERSNNRAAAAERRNVCFALPKSSSLVLSNVDYQELLRAEIEAVRSGSDAANR